MAAIRIPENPKPPKPSRKIQHNSQISSKAQSQSSPAPWALATPSAVPLGCEGHRFGRQNPAAAALCESGSSGLQRLRSSRGKGVGSKAKSPRPSEIFFLIEEQLSFPLATAPSRSEVLQLRLLPKLLNDKVTEISRTRPPRDLGF